MSIQPPRPGAGWVQEYQISGIPFVTSSTFASGTVAKLDFEYITRFFHVKNPATPPGVSTIAVGFTANGLVSSSHFFTLKAGEEFREDIRCTSLYVSGVTGSATYAYEVIAGLTSIPAMCWPVVTGAAINPQPDSAIFNGVG